MTSKKCILIPTCNRSREIEYYLEKRIDMFVDKGYEVVVFDSSTDDSTKKIVDKYKVNHENKIKYVFYRDGKEDMYGVYKVKDALNWCSKQYEYVWMCGDSVLLDISLCEERLEFLYKKKYDVIHVYKNNYKFDDWLDINYLEFFKYFYWSMTHWCSFILSSRFIQDMDSVMEDYIKSKCVNIIIHSIYTQLAEEKYKIAYVHCDCIETSPYRVVSVSQQKKDLLRGWAQATCVGIDHLPDCYKPYKREVKRITNINVNLFTKKGACDLRADGNLSLKGLLKYGRYVSEMAGKDYVWNILWCCLPQKLAQKNSYSYQYRDRIDKFGRLHKRVIVYGLGQHGRVVVRKFKYAYDENMVVAIVDQKYGQGTFENIPIIPKEKINQYGYDYILVAIIEQKVFEEVKKSLILQGIASNKICHI